MQPITMPPIMSLILSVSISPLRLVGSYVNVACKGFSPNLLKEQFNADQYGAPRKCLKGSGLLPASFVRRMKGGSYSSYQKSICIILSHISRLPRLISTEWSTCIRPDVEHRTRSFDIYFVWPVLPSSLTRWF